jgi:hypothetical protein
MPMAGLAGGWFIGSRLGVEALGQALGLLVGASVAVLYTVRLSKRS